MLTALNRPIFKAKKISTQIHTIWNIRQKESRNASALLKLASIQVLYTRLNFTARRWFTLDLTLLQMVRKDMNGSKKCFNCMFSSLSIL